MELLCGLRPRQGQVVDREKREGKVDADKWMVPRVPRAKTALAGVPQGPRAQGNRNNNNNNSRVSTTNNTSKGQLRREKDVQSCCDGGCCIGEDFE